MARLQEQGEVVHLVSKLLRAEPEPGQTADRWVRGTCAGQAQKLHWLVVEEITQLDIALWVTLTPT